jgi:diacylglycerol kinase family enzyme
MFVAGDLTGNKYTDIAHPKLGVAGEYDPSISTEVDTKIRMMPGVWAYVTKKAKELADAAGPNFEVVASHHSKTRARAYVAAANGKGIHEELTQAVLLKAALGMAGK